MKPILVVGSVALDTVSAPWGGVEDALGGSAVYFSLAARHSGPVSIVGVVGSDFPGEHRRMLERKGIDLSSLETVPGGETFRWAGKYESDLSRETLDTRLNVFESFKPKLSDEQKASDTVFLANIDPDLQLEVLSQMKAPKLVACDTMNFWIDLKRDRLTELLARVDVLFINDEEARQFTCEPNNVLAAKMLADLGPKAVILKKGEHGALLAAGGRVYPFPAFPAEIVIDPTGAGDTFAGGVMGVLSAVADLSDAARLKKAVIQGTVAASYSVSDFSTKALESLTLERIEERSREFVDLMDLSAATDRVAA